MPKIFEYFGYLLYIYVDDHLPVHIHLRIQGSEGKFILLYNNGLLSVVHEHIKNKARLTAAEITEMRKFVRKYAEKLKNNGKQYTTSKKRQPA